MEPGSIAAVCPHRPTRRQVARALSSGGFELQFFDGPELAQRDLTAHAPRLIMIDADNVDRLLIESVLRGVEAAHQRIPVVLLSLAADKSALLDLLRQHDLSNVIAKHGAIRATHPMVDEREL